MKSNMEIHLNRFKNGAESVSHTRQMLKVFLEARKNKMSGKDVKFFEHAIQHLEDFSVVVPKAIDAMEVMATQEKALVSNIVGIMGNA